MVDKRLEQFTSTLNSKQIELFNKIDSLLLDIKIEIESHKKGIGSYGTEQQLVQIKLEIEKMKSTLNYNVFVPSYPRIIVDSWDFDSELAKKLLILAEDYRKITV